MVKFSNSQTLRKFHPNPWSHRGAFNGARVGIASVSYSAMHCCTCSSLRQAPESSCAGWVQLTDLLTSQNFTQWPDTNICSMTTPKHITVAPE